MKRRVYLNHLSGTPLAPEVHEAMRPFFEEHHHGLAAREAIATARGQCAQLIGGTPEEILFTSSGTEANNLAIKGTAFAQRERGNHLVLSNIEHPSIEQSITWLEENGFEATRVPVDSEGFVSPKPLLMRSRTKPFSSPPTTPATTSERFKTSPPSAPSPPSAAFHFWSMPPRAGVGCPSI